MCKRRRLLTVLSCAVLLSGCASIVSKSNWPFQVFTTPDGADITITDRRGDEIFSGRTPVYTKLRSGAGFFARETYVVTISSPGYETKKITVQCKVNGWYFGNILIGGILGMLIIDPATGAMYQLEIDSIYESLQKTGDNSTGLRILEKNQVPAGLQSKLVKIN